MEPVRHVFPAHALVARNAWQRAPGRRRPVDLETARFRLRTLAPVDASERWLGWMADPEIMHPANLPARRMTRDELGHYIASFDGDARFLFGVFDKTSAIQLGFFWIELDRTHGTGTFNVIIGEKSRWGDRIVNECRAALLDHFFDQDRIAKACGGPLSRNFPAIFNYKAQGWIYEGTLRAQFRSVVDGSRLDQLRFRFFKEEWRAARDRGGDG
jgi:RimJ/RimL family protein N-acetyltransferase